MRGVLQAQAILKEALITALVSALRDRLVHDTLCPLDHPDVAVANRILRHASRAPDNKSRAGSKTYPTVADRGSIRATQKLAEAETSFSTPTGRTRYQRGNRHDFFDPVLSFCLHRSGIIPIPAFFGSLRPYRPREEIAADQNRND